MDLNKGGTVMRVYSLNVETGAAIGIFRRVAMPSALAIIMMTITIPIVEATAKSEDNERSAKHHLIDQNRLHNLKTKVAEMKEQEKHHHPASESGGGSSQGLTAQVAALQNQVAQLQTAVAEIALLGSRVSIIEKNSGGSSPTVLTTLAKYVTVDTNTINGVKGPHIIFRGVNVHIQSGSTMTDDGGLVLTGLGNLFIGYNENPDPSIVYDIVGCERAATGSHNLVIGKGNLVTSYGSAVLGAQNCATAKQTTILGGEVNEAHADSSTILGGNRWGTYTTKYQTFPMIR
jgi:hypothetical protein